MKINGKQVLLCLMGGIIGVALPMTLTYYGVSRGAIEGLFWLLCLILLIVVVFYNILLAKRIDDKFDTW